MFGTTILEERKSKFNGNVRVVKTWGMGTYIQANGLTQSGGIVESIWKNTLRMLNAKKINAKSVLILGLGGGTVAKLLREKYPNAKITGVEIDPIMIELGKKYLDLDKYNVDIKIMDANKFIFRDYDLVVVDTYLGDKFVDIATTRLHLAGIVIFNRLYFKDKKQESEKFGIKLRKVFKNVKTYFPPANIMYICSN